MDIFGLLPDSAVFLVRHGSEEDGAKLVVRLKQDDDSSRAERRGEGRDEFLSSQHAEKHRLNLNYAQTDGMGASGAAMVRAAPQWIHHGRLGFLRCLRTLGTQAYRRETARDSRIDDL